MNPGCSTLSVVYFCYKANLINESYANNILTIFQFQNTFLISYIPPPPDIGDSVRWFGDKRRQVITKKNKKTVGRLTK